MHDAAQLQAGKRAWEPATVLPLEAWLRRLWQQAILESGTPLDARLLTPATTLHVWRRIVAADAITLIDEAGAAATAAAAWELVHAWGTGAPSWRAWRDDGSTDDVAAFARWAETYAAELARLDAVDGALLPDALAAVAQHVPTWAGDTALLAGFVELTPQQQRLLSALRAAGMRIAQCDTVEACDSAVTVVLPDSPREEIVAALHWAAERLRGHPAERVGIVVENLAARRDAIVALAHAVLAPALLLPDAPDDPPCFDISLGEPLARVPIATAALALITLACDALPMGEAAALLRSGFLPCGAVEPERARTRRAAVEAEWLKLGVRSVDLAGMLRILPACDRALAERWQQARARAGMPASASPRDWVDRWRAWLDECGWPGDEALDSFAWQARRAWDDLLAGFAGLQRVEPRLSRHAALRALRRMAQEQLFQRESASAPIEILGVLEAAGQPFDALWVAGLTAERWPPAPAPNPLVPLRWQRERGAPRASPARELAYAQTLTTLFARAAPVVRFSSPARDGDLMLLPSSLLLGYERAAPPASAPSYADAIAGTGVLETIDDARAPPLALSQQARGGAYLVQAFADCPFQAVARGRLDTRPWPAALDGLSDVERGILVHGALAAFWRAVGDRESLLALDEDALQGRLDDAARIACTELSPARWAELPPVLREGERLRLVRTMRAWLEHERRRPAFRVESVERDATLAIGGIELRMRLDRVDALAGGGIAILDYKGGKADPPTAWFDSQRPRAPQLGLYAMALSAQTPCADVRAVAFVQLRADAIRARGLAVDRDVWPELHSLEMLARVERFDAWDDVQAWWGRHLGALVERYAAGEARVDPRGEDTCAQCGRQSLCRVERGHLVRDGEAAND